MRSQRFPLVLAAAVVSAGSAVACSSTPDIKTGPPPIDALFTSYVAIGNSLTAGMQSDGINDSTQRQSYPRLFAEQVKTRFAYPSFAGNGCPPPIVNFLTGERVGGDTNSTACSLRNVTAPGAPGAISGLLNDVAVPGAVSLDPTSESGSQPNPLTTFILGGLTQVQKGLEANPTFVSIWIGNNDALVAALSGILTPVPNISPGITPVDSFEAHYTTMLNQLDSGGLALKGGALFAVVNVVNAALLFEDSLLQNPQYLGAFEAVSGPVTLDPSCTKTSGALINFELAGAIRRGLHPPIVACAPTSNPPVGNVYVLDKTERATVTSTVAAYNAFIQSTAHTRGWAYVDVNPTLSALKASGAIPPFPDLSNPTQPFGLYVTNDGVHPSATSHRLIANLMIDSVNATYGKSIPEVSP